MQKNSIILILVLITVISCDFLKPQETEDAVARVGDQFLYESDIAPIVPSNTTKEDSTLIVNNYINNWATQQLLMNRAQLNLNEDKQAEFNKLVDSYKKDLFTSAYKEAIVLQQIDTVITESQALDYYEENKDNFKLNDRLLKLRYIQLSKDNQDIERIKQKFKRFESEDKEELDSIAIQFISYSLNDSVWVKASHVYEKIPLIQTQEKEELLKKSNFLQLEDSLRVYLVQINDELQRNEVAPLKFVEPTVKQILLNKRKLNLLKNLEVDITQDAIKNKEFEIYE